MRVFDVVRICGARREIMPIYTFRCPRCKQEYQQQRKMGDTNPPVCGCGYHCVKVIDSHPVHYKGDGFYETDYKK